MADILYTGAAQAVRQVSKITIDSVAASTAYKSTVNGKSATYTSASAGETVDTIAAGLLAALQAATDGELRELRFAADPDDAASILVTGPADGAPFTITTIPGANTTDAVVTNGTGPYHADNTANYSGGALPGASDRLIFQDGDRAAGVKYGLTALSTTAFVSLVRKSGYLGQIGLPDVNVSGYREYRPKYLEAKTTSVIVEQSGQDSGYQNRIKLTHGSASAVVVTGASSGFGGFPGGTSFSNPSLDIYGQVSTSTLAANGGSVSISAGIGLTNVTSSVSVSNGSFVVGESATPGAVVVNSSSGTLAASFDTLNVDGTGSSVTVTGSAACVGSTTDTVIDAGTVVWQSTGTPGSNVTIGSGATFDVSKAPAKITLDSIQVYEGGTLLNAADRITRPFDLHTERTDLSGISASMPTDMVYTVG